MMPSIFSQERRSPSRSGSASGAQSQGDVFNSNSGRRRPCDPNDCPCYSAEALAFQEKDCARELADFDKKISEREEEIRQINQYPQMRKSKIDPAKDPNILLYRHHKAEYQKYCECGKKFLKEMCSMSPEEFYRRQAECSETDGVPYRPYPSDRRGGRDTRPTPPRDPLGFPPANADPPPAPRILYKPDCNRSLLFVNNPEQLRSEDLADTDLGHKTVFETEVTGPSRIFFEHTNRTGFPIGYGVQLVNTSETAVTVIINGRGFVADSRGGEPFRQLFEREKSPPQVVTVGPGKFMWLLPPGANQIPNRAFLSGVADFEVRGGTATIKALGYRNINRLDGKATYEGYITRLENDPVAKRKTDESRVYKGTIDCAELVAEDVDFTIDDSNQPIGDGDKAVPLDVQFTSQNGEVINSEWRTHSISNRDAIEGDMRDINMPEGIVISAKERDSSGRVHNLGNWGVVYTLKGHVTNNGSKDRCISINLAITDPRETAAIAWRDRYGSWHQTRLPVNGAIQYYTFPVRAGQRRVPFEASFVLGGPSTTNLLHSVSILASPLSCQGSQRK
jgi:hypothetical protein